MVALEKPRKHQGLLPSGLAMDDDLPIHEDSTWTIPVVRVTKSTKVVGAVGGASRAGDLLGARPNNPQVLKGTPFSIPDPRAIPIVRVTKPTRVVEAMGDVQADQSVVGTINRPLRGGCVDSFVPPTSLAVLDELPIYDYPTWIIPAVQDARKKTAVGAEGIERRSAEALGMRELIRTQQAPLRPLRGQSGVQDYVVQIRGLIKSSGIYALSSLASPLISLVLAPFLTHHLSRTDYGAFAILNTFIVLMAGVTQLGLNAAFFRAYGYDYESERDRLHVVSTFFMMLLLVSVPTTIMMVMTSPSLAVFLLNAPSLSNAVSMCAVVVLVQNLTLPGLFWLRAQGRTVFFATISILNLLVSAGATIYFVGIMQSGIEGALLGTAVGYAVIVFTTLPAVLIRAGMRLRFDIARSMLAFGLPHVLNLISAWVLQLLDRYLLGLLGSLSQTASYAVAYSLGGALVALLITPFSMAWWVVMYSIARRDDALHIFRLIFRWFSIALLLAAFGLSTFGVIVLDSFFPPSYQAAAPVIPAVALSMVFYGANIVFSVGISLTRKTWLLTIAIGSSALLNTALNFVLIPQYGAMGAAAATLIAYIELAIISYLVNRWVYPVPFEIGLISLALLIGIALYVGSNFLAQTQALYQGWATRIVGFALYGACLVVLGTLPDRRHTPTFIGGFVS